MVDRGAVDRQAERDVDRGVERDQLGRDMPLVVILRDDQIELAVCRATTSVRDSFGNERRKRSPRRIARRSTIVRPQSWPQPSRCAGMPNSIARVINRGAATARPAGTARPAVDEGAR